MSSIIQRSLECPDQSFFLLGPRGTGKSTWLQQVLGQRATIIDLLQSKHALPLQQDPSTLAQWLNHLPAQSWVIIDEVQKIPSLLDEVHSLIENRKLRFALSGSSARKLKRSGANLLAGRALQKHMYPFHFRELGSRFDWDKVLKFGTLPVVWQSPSPLETLEAYVNMYLQNELLAEGLIRSLPPFVRFLSVAGQLNGQVMNFENIAREAASPRSTVVNYFQILEETLIGYTLPALPLGLRAKEVRHPKWYFFDVGAARAAAGFLYPQFHDPVWLGFAFENHLINEIRIFIDLHKRGFRLFYYKAHQGPEIDLLIELRRKTLSRPAQYLAIEIKSGKKWDPRWSNTLQELATGSKLITRVIGVYQGERRLSHGEIDIFPAERFLDDLHSGKIF
jgi:predicted AAA+ superfamily ATPase